jgi:hypothetical protein
MVQVQVKSGATYEGIFHTAQADKGFGVVLMMARKKEPGSTVLGLPSSTIIIQGKDFVQMSAKDVAFDESTEISDDGTFDLLTIFPSSFVQSYSYFRFYVYIILSLASPNTHHSRFHKAFMTDTDISGHADMRERALQKWVPEGDLTTDLSLTYAITIRRIVIIYCLIYYFI